MQFPGKFNYCDLKWRAVRKACVQRAQYIQKKLDLTSEAKQHLTNEMRVFLPSETYCVTLPGEL